MNNNFSKAKTLKVSVDHFSARSLETVFASLPGIAFRALAGESWTMLFLSDAFTRILGYETEDFLNNSVSAFSSLLHPLDASLSLNRCALIEQQGETYVLEYRLLDVLGNTHWMREQGVVVSQGSTRFLEGMILEITENKQIEERLKVSEAFAEGVVQSLQDPVAIIGKDHLIYWVNGPHQERYGAECTGQRCYESIMGRRVPCIECGLQDALSAQEVRRWVTTQERVTGETLLYHCVASPMRASSLPGAPHCVVTIQDITLKRRNEALKNLFVEAFKQLPVAATITDVYARVIYANPYSLAIRGVSEQDVIGEVPQILRLAPDTLKGSQSAEIWSVLGEGRIWSGTCSGVTEVGVPYEEEVIIAPVKDDRGVVGNFIIIQKDITLLRTLERQLHQAQKMEAVGLLAGGVAHDFNNILAVITGYTEFAIDASPENDDLKRDMTNVLDACDRASSLVRQLLIFSKNERTELVPLDLNDTITGVVRILQRILGEQVRLSFLPSSATLQINGDQGQLEQVLLNLCINARDAMPDGGELLIKTELFSVEESFRAYHSLPDRGDYAKILVSDTGEGMDEITRRRIFEPFFTTKDAGKGTGLGLSTVHGIVIRHDGMIDVISEPGKGTTFSLYFPLLETESRRITSEMHVYEPVSHNGDGYTLLLAEDDEQLRALAIKILIREGYRVLAARDGKDALDIYTSHWEEIDLVLLDVIMPGVSGIKIYETIMSTGHGTPVAFVSGYSYSMLADQGLPEGDISLLRKPFTRDELVRFVFASIPDTSE